MTYEKKLLLYKLKKMLHSLIHELQEVSKKRYETQFPKTVAAHLFNICVTTLVVKFTQDVLDSPPVEKYDFNNKLG